MSSPRGGGLLLLLLAAALPVRAATYYVATNGSDSNPGTSDAPLGTIQRGVDLASPGDTVIVRAGTYYYSGPQDGMAVMIDKAGTSSGWITLEAEQQGAVFLNGSDLCHSFLRLGASAAYWVIDGFDISHTRWSGISSNSGGGQNIQVEGNVIHHIGNRSDTSSFGITGVYLDQGGSNFKIDGNVFHDIGRIGGDGRHDHAIYSHGNTRITNNVFYNLMNGWHVQTAAGFSGVIAFNTFFGPDPVAGTVGQVMLWDANSNVLIEDNVFFGPTSVGITSYALSMSGTCSIDHNIVFNEAGAVAMVDSAPGCQVTGNLLNVDPKLVRASVPDYDFHLQPGSPATGAGIPVSGVSADFDGQRRPSPTGFDLGAYQYLAATPGTPGPGPGTGSPIVGVQSPYAFRAPQRFLSPAIADGINDEAVFGPMAKQVTVFDAQGREVFQALRSGNTPIVWTGRDASGRVVHSGAYVVQIIKDDGTIAYQSIAIVK